MMMKRLIVSGLLHTAAPRLVRGESLLSLIGFFTEPDDDYEVTYELARKLTGNAFSAFSFASIAIARTAAFGASLVGRRVCAQSAASSSVESGSSEPWDAGPIPPFEWPSFGSSGCCPWLAVLSIDPRPFGSASARKHVSCRE